MGTSQQEQTKSLCVEVLEYIQEAFVSRTDRHMSMVAFLTSSVYASSDSAASDW